MSAIIRSRVTQYRLIIEDEVQAGGQALTHGLNSRPRQPGWLSYFCLFFPPLPSFSRLSLLSSLPFISQREKKFSPTDVNVGESRLTNAKGSFKEGKLVVFKSETRDGWREIKSKYSSLVCTGEN